MPTVSFVDSAQELQVLVLAMDYSFRPALPAVGENMFPFHAPR